MTAATRDIAARVREAAAAGTRLRVTGRGTWSAANRPVMADALLSVAECAGIVDYVPGDLTLTARAGTPLADIARATRAHGQWLALDPYGGDAGSIGATVATASAGPHATAFGTPRDLLLGVEFVTGMGDIVRGGGRVVKNVAGFDLVRLTAGAWGTLGVITEVTVRLRALPETHETLALGAADDPAALHALATGLRALTTVPFACELVSGALAARLGLPGAPALMVRIAGNADSLRAQRDGLARLGAGAFRPADDAVWSALRGAESPDCAVWRMSQRPSRFAATWGAARQAVAPLDGAWMHGSPLRGVVRCVAPATLTDPEAVRRVRQALAAPFDGMRIGEVLPGPAWSALRPAAADHLSRGIRAAFDPRRILNPGIMGDVA